MNHAPRITDELIRDVAEDAGAAERSVMRRILGLRVRGRAQKRVDAALAARGVAAVAGEEPAA
jgi:hypothetical protein